MKLDKYSKTEVGKWRAMFWCAIVGLLFYYLMYKALGG